MGVRLGGDPLASVVVVDEDSSGVCCGGNDIGTAILLLNSTDGKIS